MGQSGLVGQMGLNSPVNDTQYPAHHLRLTGKQKS